MTADERQLYESDVPFMPARTPASTPGRASSKTMPLARSALSESEAGSSASPTGRPNDQFRPVGEQQASPRD